MNIVVLAGGTSTERDVSLITGRNVMQSLRRSGHNALLLDVFLGWEGDYTAFFDQSEQNVTAAIGEDEPDIEKILASRKGEAKGLFGPNVMNICKTADIVFIALHGEDGEDGKVQAALDLNGVKYTGSAPFGSALAMNKYYSKQIMNENGIRNAKYIVTRGGEERGAFPLPCVIKPFSGGSSVGVSIAQTEEEYQKALALAGKYESDILVEEYIKGREFSVGILGDTVLPPIEICPKEGFYDYANKYQADRTEEICPAVLSEELTKEIQSAAKRVFEVLDLEVYGRIDFIMQEGTNAFYCLEANSLPGMTSMSLLPQEAAAIGIDYDTLCLKIIELSEKKYA